MVARLLDDLPVTPPGEEPPVALRVAVRGWVGFVEAASLDWLEHRGLGRADLREMLDRRARRRGERGGGRRPAGAHRRAR